MTLTQKLPKLPKVIIRYIITNFMDLSTIKYLIFTVPEIMIMLDESTKNFLKQVASGFINASKSGNIDIMKWLYKFDHDQINQMRARSHIGKFGAIGDCTNGEIALAIACQYNYIDIVKWLVDIKINPNFNDDCPHAIACFYGHLDLVKYLYYSCRVDSDYNYQAFVLVCKHKHYDIAKWLYTLNDPCINEYLVLNPKKAKCIL